MSRQLQRENGSKASENEISDGKNSIQVLNLSFPRCGTRSVQAALDQLGYKCWHSSTCFGNATQCERWRAALDAKYNSKGTPFNRHEWEAIFQPYSAVSADAPATAFAEELVAIFSDAKVILVERDEDSWFKSFDAVVIDNLFRWDLRAVSYLDTKMIGPVINMHWHWIRSWWRVDGKDAMRAKARSMYRDHNRIVRAVTPPHRLLEFHLKDGWRPLCEFLGHDIPAMPFPVDNARGQVKARLQSIWVQGLQIIAGWALRVLVPLFACAIAWWIYGLLSQHDVAAS